jgi:hypothetical protein
MTDAPVKTDNATPTTTVTTPIETSTPPPAAPNPEPPKESFKVPDAYKDKGWAKNIKTEDDFWKSLDNAQSAMGKKYLAPDLTTMSDKEKTAYFESVRPKDPSEYVMPEKASDFEKQTYAKVLHEAGISKAQGELLVSKFLEAAQGSAAYSAEGLMNIAKESWGDKAEAKVGELGNLLKEHISENDWKMFENALPNDVAGMVLRIVDSFQKAYGANEGSGNASDTRGAVDVSAEIKKVDSDLEALRHRPHSTKEKMDLLNKRSELMKRS